MKRVQWHCRATQYSCSLSLTGTSLFSLLRRTHSFATVHYFQNKKINKSNSADLLVLQIQFSRSACYITYFFSHRNTQRLEITLQMIKVSVYVSKFQYSLTMLFCRAVTPCGFVGRYKLFGEISCLHSTALEVEEVCSSETLVCTHKFTPCYNSEEQHRCLYQRENVECLQYFLLSENTPIKRWE
jgi:hypothetical protein